MGRGLARRDLRVRELPLQSPRLPRGNEPGAAGVAGDPRRADGSRYFYKEHAHGAAARSRWSRMLRPLVDAVHSMGKSRSFWWAGFLSFWYLALQVVPIFALMRGYGLALTPWAALVMLVILRLGTVIPQAPGNVGSFQALVVASLGIFGYSRADSTGFATLCFFVVTVPLWLGGFVALILTRMRLGDIRREARASFDSR